MQMPGRSYAGGAYRFGFNGQEKDDEVHGVGNTNTAQFWEYECRLGRRWNVDIKYKHYMSNYSTFGLNPILNIDPNGDDFYKNKITGNIEEHPTGWFEKKPKSDQSKWAYVSKYNYTDWKGSVQYTNWWLRSKIERMDRAVEGHSDPANLGTTTEHEWKVTGDIAIVTVSAITIIVSCGTAAPAVTAMTGLTVTSSVVGLGGGTSKLVFDVKGNYEMSDRIPVTAIGGTIGIVIDYEIGDKKGTYTTMGDVAGGAIFGGAEIKHFLHTKHIQSLVAGGGELIITTIHTLEAKMKVTEKFEEHKKESKKKLQLNYCYYEIY